MKNNIPEEFYNSDYERPYAYYPRKYREDSFMTKVELTEHEWIRIKWGLMCTGLSSDRKIIDKLPQTAEKVERPKGTFGGQKTRYEIEGREYFSFASLLEGEGVTMYMARKKLNSDDYPEWKTFKL